MAWNISDLEFPKSAENNILPMLCDEGKRNPIYQLIKDGKDIEAASVEENWSDDRCDCFNVIVTIEGKKYGFSAWWLSLEGTRMLFQAECLKKEALDGLKEYILEWAEDMN
jgi:hypothetical protein